MKLAALGVAAAVLALDLLTKWWVKSTPWLHYHKVIDGFFTIHFVRNEGIAFGLFHSNPSAWKPVILSVLAVAAAVMVLYYIRTSPPEERGVQLFMGLLLGGILGNFCDRLWRGYVVDFLGFHWQDRFAWPTFNLADAAITCGVAAILYQGFFGAGGGDQASSRPSRKNTGTLGAFLLAGLLSAPLAVRGESPASTETVPAPAGQGAIRVHTGSMCPNRNAVRRVAGTVECRDDFYHGLLGGASASPGALEVVDRVQARYDRIESFSADFRQVFQSQGVFFESDWGEGILLMKRPGKMYWEYRRPTRKLFVADGEQTFFYVPSENQVTITDLDPETADTPLLFLLGPKRIRDDFLVEFETGEGPMDESNLLLRLTPVQARPEFSHLFLELSSRTWLIQRLSVVEPIGNRNDYIFSRFRENVKIRDKQFRLELPDGVEIIRIGSGAGRRPDGEPGRSLHRSRIETALEFTVRDEFCHGRLRRVPS